MFPAIEKVMLILQPLGLAVMLIYTYGLFQRSLKSKLLVNMLMGKMFGIAACIAMLAPIPIAEGVIIDIRNLFVGIAG
ncbi:MAG: LytS/YhcK type 5TM receptor domain-containing protein, partial [Pseudomonadota bacterium]